MRPQRCLTYWMVKMLVRWKLYYALSIATLYCAVLHWGEEAILIDEKAGKSIKVLTAFFSFPLNSTNIDMKIKRNSFYDQQLIVPKSQARICWLTIPESRPTTKNKDDLTAFVIEKSSMQWWLVTADGSNNFYAISFVHDEKEFPPHVKSCKKH